MTNKKSMLTRIGVVVLAAMLAVLYLVPASVFAEDANTNTVPKNGTITVTNVDKDATSVTAYQIVKAEYKGESFVDWKAANAQIEGIFTQEEKVDYSKAPSPAQLAALDLQGIKPEKLMNQKPNDTTFTKSGMEPGLYLVKIQTDNGNIVYNPMILGVNLQEGDKAPSSSLDLSNAKYGEKGAAKKSEAKVDKTIVADKNAPQNTKGNDMQIGDEVEFKIDITIPSYSNAFVHPTCNITDTLTNLNYKENSLSVKVGDEEFKAEGNYTSITDKNKLTVNFTSDFIMKHRGEAVSINYTATLADSAETNFNGDNTNKVEYEFSNNPYNDDDKGTDEDITHHYTFELDGSVNGKLTETSHEFIKTGDEIKKKDTEITTHGALDGAKFQLYTDADCEKPFGDEVETGKDGKIHIKGLNGSTAYYLKETFAPSPYKIDNKVIKIQVIPTFNEDGTLQKYHFQITEGKKIVDCTEYTAEYENNGVTVSETEGTKDNHYEFVNSKSPVLPSTGGMGTYIFTIAGIAIIAIAAGMHFKKKAEEK